VSSSDGHDSENPDASCNPQKIHAFKGLVVAKDYEVVIQEILKEAIGLFCSHVTVEHAYSDYITHVIWVKEAWLKIASHVMCRSTLIMKLSS